MKTSSPRLWTSGALEVGASAASPRPRGSRSTAKIKELPRLVVVANRLPVQPVGAGSGPSSEREWETSSGGLVTALAPILKRSKGVWVGWSGAANQRAPAASHDGIALRPVTLSPSDIEGFYEHLANATLWPLYHDAIRTPEFDHRYWRPYVEVNQRYARAAARAAGEGDLVWVHDYHLQLVPAMLRKLRPDLRIGFFMHIPFPPEELFAWLPWRRQILEGLLGADVIGFQTHAGVRNFSGAAREFTDAEGTDTLLTLGDRTVRIGSWPISIDTEWFEKAAADPAAIRAAAQVRERLGKKRTILLCVDRLDYTKGIDSRLLAFESLLREGGVSVEDAVLVQIAVPSRERVAEYGTMRRNIERLVGRINGQFAEPGLVGVHYFRRNYSREDLVPFYLAADVMVVTPLRDGMNLVAKEYVATRRNNTGVLILSEFAGAARELRRALLVNPRDIEGMVRTMREAITMPAADARQRMAILRSQVRRHDVYDWAREFLEALQE